MKSNALKRVTGLLICSIRFSGLAQAPLEATNATAAVVATNLAVGIAAETNTQAEAEQALRALLQLQEQRHVERLLEEQSRQAAESADAAQRLAGRLETIEQVVLGQRERDFQSMQSSNRTLLIVATSFAGVSLLTMVLTSVLQWRAISRLTEATSGTMGPPFQGSAMVPDPPTRLIGSAASARWFGAVERLEARVRELEDNVGGDSVSLRSGSGDSRDEALGNESEAPTMLLGKAQALMNLGKADEALKCFDAVLGAQPARTEAMLGKGLALERLKRFDEAIEWYDRASASDPSFKRAWLCKAGLLNQQERFAEALVCYERALQLHESANQRDQN
jgi:tetratricopeptide (TPR) repeat protein